MNELERIAFEPSGDGRDSLGGGNEWRRPVVGQDTTEPRYNKTNLYVINNSIGVEHIHGDWPKLITVAGGILPNDAFRTDSPKSQYFHKSVLDALQKEAQNKIFEMQTQIDSLRQALSYDHE